MFSDLEKDKIRKQFSLNNNTLSSHTVQWNSILSLLSYSSHTAQWNSILPNGNGNTKINVPKKELQLK